jgi:hypothetical protein
VNLSVEAVLMETVEQYFSMLHWLLMVLSPSTNVGGG